MKNYELKKLKPKTGHYDINAPKFVYRKNIMSFTRKTSRLKKDDPKMIGSVVDTRYTSGGARQYPYTKPMKGYERVLVGYGKYVGKGRHKKGRMNNRVQLSKPHKRIWTPYISTYGSIQAGLKYGSEYRNKKV